jgi:uncharacterized membrane protein YfcA
MPQDHDSCHSERSRGISEQNDKARISNDEAGMKNSVSRAAAFSSFVIDSSLVIGHSSFRGSVHLGELDRLADWLLTKVHSIPSLGFILAAAAIIGGIIGSHLGSRRFAVRVISLCLATVLVIAGMKLIFTR